ncbi:MAG TPA: phosphoenolpyruvate--protein phosphotransferase, partial [Phycisphaerae bacterium]|nr:phosphoenolpyruvate--protein phosphotransferase [Phycisphaerae bacterium]
MKIKEGIGVSSGVAVSPAVVIGAEEFDIPQRHISLDLADEELVRLDQAINDSQQELQELKKHTAEQIGTEAAKIFDFHLGLIRDKELVQKLRTAILETHVTAEFAVATVLRSYAKEFLSMPQYLADRVKDIYDIEKRLLRNLTGQMHQSLTHLDRDIIALAHDLTPSQTASMDRQHVLGIAIDAGGKTSHTAIVAKALGIPAVVGLNDATSQVIPGERVIVDGTDGLLIINPDAETLEKYRKLAVKQVEFIHSLDEIRDLSAVTKDGHEVRLMGNIEFPTEANTVLSKGGEGIGLYRTEFLYLGSKREPTEEEHFQAYREVIDACDGRPVVIRTFDLGADKRT